MIGLVALADGAHNAGAVHVLVRLAASRVCNSQRTGLALASFRVAELWGLNGMYAKLRW